MAETDNVRVVFYITPELEAAHHKATSQVVYELEEAFKRNDLQSAANLNAVMRYLAEIALSWHGGRDLGILEAYEEEGTFNG